MCCLFGLIDTRRALTGREKSGILHILAAESEARGTDAAGIAYNAGGRLHLCKRPLPGRRLRIRVPDEAAAVMGHTRMTAQGRASRNRDNHPFSGAAGSVPFALAHNGVLYNDRQLRRDLGLPRTRIETDSYAAVQLLEREGRLDFECLRRMAEQVEGSFVFTVLDGADNLYIVRGDNPLCLYWFPERGIYLYNSTEEILARALRRVRLPLGEPSRIPLGCSEILHLDPDVGIRRSTFHSPWLLRPQAWLPLSWAAPCRGWGERPAAGAESHLAEIKSVAPAFGYPPEEIDRLADRGFSPEELEEMLYCGEL